MRSSLLNKADRAVGAIIIKLKRLKGLLITKNKIFLKFGRSRFILTIFIVLIFILFFFSFTAATTAAVISIPFTIAASVFFLI